MRNGKNRRKLYLAFFFLLLALLLSTSTVLAASDEEIKKVLLNNRDLFNNNNIISTFMRWLGWMLIRGLTFAAAGCAELFDKSFEFIDFTRWGPVEKFLDSWTPVFFALIALALIFLGITLIFDHDKKPKFVINLCIAVLVVSSSAYLIDQLNGFISQDIRSAILNDGDEESDTTEMVYQMVGASIYDLVYLDDKIDGGLMKVTEKNRKIYSDFTEKDMDLIDINEIVKPEEVGSESQDLMGKKIVFRKGDSEDIIVKEVYNGVAWTDLLNEYYFRYDVSWFSAIIALISLILVYICLAYKVVRLLIEIVIHRLLAVLYSANLTNGQKTIKILDSIKDSYITMILVMVCLKIYLLVYQFINKQNFGTFTECMLLLFAAFAVIDGPNIIQKLTGVDAGLSSGVGKLIAGIQATRMMGMMMPHVGRGSGSGARTGEHGSGVAAAAREGLAQDTRQDDAAMTGAGGPDSGGSSDVPKDEMLQGQENPNEAGSNERSAAGGTDQDAAMTGTGEPPGTAGAGSGFQETDSGAADSGEMQAYNQDEADLNGVDPVSGAPDRNQDLSAMEQDLADQGTHSGLEHTGTVEFGGTMFRAEWKDTLDKQTTSSTGPDLGRPGRSRKGSEAGLHNRHNRMDLEDK